MDKKRITFSWGPMAEKVFFSVNKGEKTNREICVDLWGDIYSSSDAKAKRAFSARVSKCLRFLDDKFLIKKIAGKWQVTERCGEWFIEFIERINSHSAEKASPGVEA